MTIENVFPLRGKAARWEGFSPFQRGRGAELRPPGATGGLSWLLRQKELPGSYVLSEKELPDHLCLTSAGVLLYRHDQAGLLPLGQIRSSRLVCYRAAVSFWGFRRLSCIREWWDKHYRFCPDRLAQLLLLGAGGRVYYRGKLMGHIDHGVWWIFPLYCLIYSSYQLRLMRCQLEGMIGHKLNQAQLR